MKRKQAIYLKKNSESNDSKDDPKSQKEDGGTGRENTEMYNKDLEELNNKQ